MRIHSRWLQSASEVDPSPADVVKDLAGALELILAYGARVSDV